MQNNIEFRYNYGHALGAEMGDTVLGYLDMRTVWGGELAIPMVSRETFLQERESIYGRAIEAMESRDIEGACIAAAQKVFYENPELAIAEGFLMAVSVTLMYRMAQYLYLSLKYRVQESDLPVLAEKLVLPVGFCIFLEVIAMFLEQRNVLLYTFEVMKAVIVAFAPYAVGNFVKDFDYISGEQVLYYKDFVKRGLIWLGLGLVAGLYLVPRLMDQYWSMYSEGVFYYGLTECFVPEDLWKLGVYTEPAFEILMYQMYYPQLFVALAGKMSLDLLMSHAQSKGWINDLRNPTGISREFLRRCGLKFKKQEAKEASERRALAIARESLKIQRERAAQEARKTKEPQQESLKRPEASQQQYPTAELGSTNFKREVMANHEKSSKKRTGRGAPVKRAKQAPTNVPNVATMKFELKGGKKVEFVRLFGFGCEGKNIWGFIPEGFAGAENMRMYRNTLAGGHVKARHSIAYDKHASDFKLRSNSNARLHGGVALSSKGLHRYMDDKDAGHIFDTLRGLGQDTEVMQLVVFNREVAKH